MRKITLILISLALIAACFVPCVAFAAASPTTEERDSVHFIAPTAITVVGDNLYVADNIEDNKTAIICFDATSNSPEPLSTFELDIAVDGMSHNNDNAIYAYGPSGVTELKIGVDGAITVGETYNSFADGVTIVDFAYGNLPYSATQMTLYALTQNSILQYLDSKFQTFANLSSLTETAGLLSVNNGTNAYLYYLHSGTCDRYNLNKNAQDEDFARKLAITSGFTPTGIFALESKIGLFGNTEIYEIEESTLHADTVTKLSLAQLYGADCRILDVEAHGERLIVLNSRNQIDIFDKTDNVYDTTNYATIGSDMVSKTVPTKYTSFTLARPNGYPANIVYKTMDEETSIENIYTDVADYNEYIILGYDGDESSHYYYVMIGDKFGWVKKSDKWTTVDTQFGDPTVKTEAKFVSLNSVYIYELPRSSATQTLVTQTATSMKTITVLQKFTEDDQVWYYVEYEEGKTGFVKSDVVGKFTTTPKEPDIKIAGDRKINSSLFAAVNLYATADLNEGEEIVNAEGNAIKLYSGSVVKLIREENDKSYVAVYDGKGNADYGWLESERLIDVHQITTNAIVGLSLLGFAVVLAAVLAIVYFKRKKRIKANRD